MIDGLPKVDHVAYAIDLEVDFRGIPGLIDLLGNKVRCGWNAMFNGWFDGMRKFR